MKPNAFTTRDIYLAATLITLKFFMEGIDYQIEGDRSIPVGYFRFKNTPELEDARMKYWQGYVTVEPRAFITNMRSLKAEITNTYKNPRL